MPLSVDSEDPTRTSTAVYTILYICSTVQYSCTCKIPVSSGTAGEGAPAPETSLPDHQPAGARRWAGATACGGAGALSVGQGGTVPPVVWVCGSRRIGVGSDLARSGSTDDALDLRSSSGVEVEVHGD